MSVNSDREFKVLTFKVKTPSHGLWGATGRRPRTGWRDYVCHLASWSPRRSWNVWNVGRDVRHLILDQFISFDQRPAHGHENRLALDVLFCRFFTPGLQISCNEQIAFIRLQNTEREKLCVCEPSLTHTHTHLNAPLLRNTCRSADTEISTFLTLCPGHHCLMILLLIRRTRQIDWPESKIDSI